MPMRLIAMSKATAPGTDRPLFPPLLAVLDAGWLFLLAGLGLLAATVLIPAAEDLAEARNARDTALVLESLHEERFRRHAEYLDAVEARDPVVMRQLAARQFNRVPADARPIIGAVVPASLPATVFSQLEPDPVPAPILDRSASTLSKLATGERSRLWLIAIGAVLVLVGIMPHARSDPS